VFRKFPDFSNLRGFALWATQNQQNGETFCPLIGTEAKGQGDDRQKGTAMTVLQFPTDRVRQSGTGKTPPRLERVGVVSFTPRTEAADKPTLFLDELGQSVPGSAEAAKNSVESMLRKLGAKRRVNAVAPVRDDIWDEYKLFEPITDRFDVDTSVDAPMASTSEAATRKVLTSLLERAENSRSRQVYAESLVRFIGSNTHHAKLRYGVPSLAFKLRMASSIFMMNGAKHPNRLIARVKDILAETDQASAKG
jgi:hypothetical protein